MGVSRASFASAEETREVTGMMIGGVTALALPEGLPVYADVRLLEMDYVILGAGSRSGKLKMAPQGAGETPGSGVRRGVVDPRWSDDWAPHGTPDRTRTCNARVKSPALCH